MVTHRPRILLLALIAIFVWPSLALAQRPAVLVNPHVQGKGTAPTIQEAIGMVDPGGKVMVVPGTYDEAIVIDKGLTLEAVGGESGVVIVEPSGAPATAIEIATDQPVVIRGLTVRSTGNNGIRGIGAVDVTIERVTVTAVTPPFAVDRLISVANEASPPGERARLAVRESFLDGSIVCLVYPIACTADPASPSSFPEVYGIIVAGDVDAVLERNVIRRTGAACIFVIVRNDLAGEANVDIRDNDLDECQPRLRGSAIFVGPRAGVEPSQTQPVTATGQVNIVGNTIRNSSGSCRPTTAISYLVFGGDIERNLIEGVVQSCAFATARTRPAGIWVGGSLQSSFYPPVDVNVQFNDIVGNAQAGLRVAPNMTAPLKATCNWWGDASGPSGAAGLGSGDAIVVESGAATPDFRPWASAPIAETDETTCTGGN